MDKGEIKLPTDIQTCSLSPSGNYVFCYNEYHTAIASVPVVRTDFQAFYDTYSTVAGAILTLALFIAVVGGLISGWIAAFEAQRAHNRLDAFAHDLDDFDEDRTSVENKVDKLKKSAKKGKK